MFLPNKYHQESDPWMELPAAGSLALKVGDALALSSGKVTLCTAGATAEYVCMQTVDGTTTTGDMIHVIPVNKTTEFATELTVAISALAAGETYQINTTGDSITATTNGTAKVRSFTGTAIGDTVYLTLGEVAVVEEDDG